MKTTRWTAPCGCVMDYDWEEVPGAENTHTNFRTQKSCIAHHEYLTCASRYDAMLRFCRNGR